MKKIIFAMLVACSAFAQPSITGVTGTIENGQSLIISGSGFGSKDQPGPILFDDFESGTPGSALAGSADWDSPGYGSPAVWTSAWSHSGTVGVGAADGYTWAAARKNTDPITGSDQMYACYWYYYADVGPDDGGEGKGFRFGSSSSAGGAGPYNGLGTTDLNAAQLFHEGHVYGPSISIDGAFATRPARVWYDSISGSVNVEYISGFDHVIGYNRPTNEEYYVKLSTPDESDGVVYASRADGVLASSDVASVMNRRSTGMFRLNAWLPSLGSSGYVYGDHQPYFDDAYLDTTPQRVMIGNASTYAACTYREIQLPTAWSNTSATVTLRQLDFEADEDAWVFIFDADNQVSTGYPITWGGSGGGTTTPDIQSATRSGGNAVLTWLSGDGGPYTAWLQADDVRSIVTADTTVTIPMSTAATDVTVKDGTSVRRASIPE